MDFEKEINKYGLKAKEGTFANFHGLLKNNEIACRFSVLLLFFCIFGLCYIVPQSSKCYYFLEQNKGKEKYFFL